MWFTKFRESEVAQGLTQANFYDKLIKWRDTTEDGEVFYQNNVEVLDESDKPKDASEQNSRYTGNFRYIEKSNDKVKAMDAVRESVDATQLG